MNPDKLLDAIGLLDDRYFEAQETTYVAPWCRRLIALAAAVLAMILTVGTVMAVSSEFRALIFSVFNIETHEQPPAGNTDTLPTEECTRPTQTDLQLIDMVNIDGVVEAHYFTSDGTVLTCEGGFYTCSRTDAGAAPENAAFWEIRTDGIKEIESSRIDFSLTHGNHTMQIIFDYAILNEKLSIKAWPQNMNEDPVGNGWNVETIGNRTDIVLLSIPVPADTDYTHDFLLLDLATMETTDLLKTIPHDSMIMDACWITDDLHYSILMGIDQATGNYGYWLCDLERSTIKTMDDLTGTDAASPYFLDDSTIIFKEMLGEGRFNVVSYHIPTGVQKVMIANIGSRSGDNAGYRGIQRNGGNGKHGLLFREDEGVELIDLRTGASLDMAGLDRDKLTTSESPDGTRIMIAYEETNENGELGYGFSKLGILDPKSGVLQILTRQISGNPETFQGWTDNDTLVITAHDAAGSYYVYMYVFKK